MKIFLAKLAIVGCLLATVIAPKMIVADESIPIPVNKLKQFDDAMAKINEANKQMQDIRNKVAPYSDAIRVICEASLYEAGIKTEDVGKYELDPASKSLKLKK